MSIQEDKQNEKVFFTVRNFDDELIKIAKQEELENWKKNNMLVKRKFTVEEFVSVSLVFVRL